MNKQLTNKILIFLLPLIFFIQQQNSYATSGKINVSVSIQPQVYFLERIGGNKVRINLLVPPGKNPATFAPTPRQVAKLVKSRIFFTIGVPFENALLPKIRNIAKNTLIVETQKGIKKRRISAHHGHENEEEHHKEEGIENDPHIWLNPLMVKIQAKTILQALIQHDPANAQYYRNNYHVFALELDQVHLNLKKTLAPLKSKTIYVFHPSFGYFTDLYQLNQEAIEVEGKRPKIKALAKFIKNAKKENIKVIFVQPQFDRNTAQKIAAAIKGTVVTLDPMAKNYIYNLELMAGKIKEALIE